MVFCGPANAADPPALNAPRFPEAGWHDLQRLVTMGEHFETLPADLLRATEEWRAWYDLEAPESVPMPQGYHEKLTPLERMLVLRCFRVDRIYVAITKYVIELMGERYVAPPVLDFKKVRAMRATRLQPHATEAAAARILARNPVHPACNPMHPRFWSSRRPQCR